jgi:hypothetical protein
VADEKFYGVRCPNCQGVRLHCEGTKRPSVGVTRRYRVCIRCGWRVIVEERIIQARPPKTVRQSDGTLPNLSASTSAVPVAG